MLKVLTAEEMRKVDRLTTEKYGIPSIILMENAAHATAGIIKEKLGGSVYGKSFLVLCGKGNNGGDGAALARILSNEGADVHTYLFGKVEETKGDARENFRIIQKISDDETDFYPIFWEDDGQIDFLDELTSDIDQTENFDAVIDAFFGTGLTRPLEESLVTQLEVIFTFLSYKTKYPLRVSIDLPSGLNADLQQPIGEHLKADVTVTFTSPKLANVLPPASNFNGDLYVVNIGSPQELIDSCSSQTYLVEREDAEFWLLRTRFSEDSYKNKRGNALLIVGSKNYSGAAVLTGNAAIETGVGLVTVATSESAQQSVSARILPEIITQSLPETQSGAISFEAFEKINKLSEKADVLAIGSGLTSDEETTRELVRKVVEERTTPVVIDADGLNALAPFDLHDSEDLPLILTPHEGEFLRLLGTDDKEKIKDRVKAVRDFAEKHKVFLVLKGERILIADPNGRVLINPTGNSGLGKAGNGDNLTGIIAGFVAQAVQAEVDIFETVVAAVYIAGLAGDFAERKFGKRTMLASDVRESLTEAFREIEGKNE